MSPEMKILIIGLFVFCIVQLLWLYDTRNCMHNEHKGLLRYLHDISKEFIASFKSIRQQLTQTNEELKQHSMEFMRIKRLIRRDSHPHVYLKGHFYMDYNKLLYTVARPEPTAGDIKNWVAQIFVAGRLVKEVIKDIAVEALDFAIPKGTKDVQVGVFFEDSSGNKSGQAYSEMFDVIDNIAPPAPGEVTVTAREMTDDDRDVLVIDLPEPAPEPDPLPEPTPDPEPLPAPDEEEDDDQGQGQPVLD